MTGRTVGGNSNIGRDRSLETFDNRPTRVHFILSVGGQRRRWIADARLEVEISPGFLLLPGLFNAHYIPLYDRLISGSRAALHMAFAMFATPLALAMFRA